MRSFFNINLTVANIILVLVLVFSVILVTQSQQQIYAQLLQPPSKILCSSMEVSDLSVVSKRYGGAVVLGIITNNSTITHENVGVVGEFYDSFDKLVGVESSLAEFSKLAPGDRSPFKIDTDISNQTMNHFTISCAASGRQPS
jgi:hypothetical protein